MASTMPMAHNSVVSGTVHCDSILNSMPNTLNAMKLAAVYNTVQFNGIRN